MSSWWAETSRKSCGLPKRSGRRSIYYGWVMLPLSMAVLIASSPGQTFGVSVFNEPMRLALRLSHGQLALAYTLGTLLGAMPIVYIGRLTDRYGLRRSLLVVVTLFSLACVMTGCVQGWLSLVAAFTLLRMLGPGALGLLSGNTLAYWFERRLGMVEGLRQWGMAVAMATIPAIHLWLLAHWGWRGAYVMLGAAVWLVLFPWAAVLFRNRPAEVGQRMDGLEPALETPLSKAAGSEAYWGLTLNQTLRTPAFWIVTGGTTVFGLVHTAVFFCVVPIFQERGLSAGNAAATLTLFAVCLAVAQLLGGLMADRIAAPYLLTAGLIGLSSAVLMLLVANSPKAAFLAGAAFGVSQGVYFGATHPLWARYFGLRHLGKIRGTLMAIMVSSSALGPLLAGLTRDWHGDFTPALITFALMPLPFAVFSLGVKHPGASDRIAPRGR